MTKNLTKVGNSVAVIIDRAILELLGIPEDGAVQLTTDGRRLIIEAAPAGESRKAKMKRIQGKIIAKHGRTFAKLAK